jgi:glycosyltransferase involved in cell wall biosynthesis
MKKILLIINGYPSKTNKQYTAYIKSIKETLEDSGQEVDLLVMYADFGSGKISKIKSYFKYYLKLFLFKNYSKYDHLYINNYPHSFLPLILKLTKMNNLIVHLHGADIFAEKLHSKILNKLSYLFIPKSCKHIAPSKYFAKAVSKTLNINEKDIFISASGGVNTDIFIPKKKEKKGFHIGFASHVSKEKGFDMFAKMIDNIGAIEEKLNIKLYFHYISYGNEKIFYENKFKNNSNVKIHNLYPKDNMPNFYSEIDLLLLLSTRLAESLGLVSLEAMSCDIPVVGTDAFAVKEYISSGETGERFKMRNYDDMLLAIKKVIENYNNYKPREYIINKYSNKSVSYGYKEYFNDK